METSSDAAFPMTGARALLAAMADGFPAARAVDHASFWVKDAQFRFVMGNRSVLDQCGRASETEILGQTDFDLFPQGLAHKFRTDDLAVLQTGRRISNIVELVPNDDGTVGWYRTTKIPVLDHDGNAVGVAGASLQVAQAESALSPDDELAPVLRFFSENFHADVRMPALAERLGMSLSRLERRFKATLGQPPLQFLIRVRVVAACRLLAGSRKTIGRISAACGFYDQAHFCRQFARVVGLLPSQYRKVYG